MGKHEICGMRYMMVPNSKADMRFRKKSYLRNKDIADRRIPKSERECIDCVPIDFGDAMFNQIEKPEIVQPILVHGAMKYACENCGLSWWMFLEKGLEEHGENHKPVPFTIQCPVCNGFANDISGICKMQADEYSVLPFGESYFKNDKSHDCGIPVYGRIAEIRGIFCAKATYREKARYG